MGGEMSSRKRHSELRAEAAHVLDEEQRRWGSAVDPPANALDHSQEDKQQPRWRGTSLGNGEGLLRQNGAWTNGRGDSSETNNPANISVDEPVPKLAGRKWSQRDLLGVGFNEVLIATCTDYEDRRYFQPRRDHDTVYMLKVAESSEKMIQQGLRELFGALKILVNVPIIFTLELIHFLNKSIFQVLVVGLLTTIGDQMLEPFLGALFNSVLQPLLKFLLNVLCSIRNLSYPLLDILKGICLQVALVLRAFRLVEINHHQNKSLAEKV